MQNLKISSQNICKKIGERGRGEGIIYSRYVAPFEKKKNGLGIIYEESLAVQDLPRTCCQKQFPVEKKHWILGKTEAKTESKLCVRKTSSSFILKQ